MRLLLKAAEFLKFHKKLTNLLKSNYNKTLITKAPVKKNRTQHRLECLNTLEKFSKSILVRCCNKTQKKIYHNPIWTTNKPKIKHITILKQLSETYTLMKTKIFGAYKWTQIMKSSQSKHKLSSILTAIKKIDRHKRKCCKLSTLKTLFLCCSIFRFHHDDEMISPVIVSNCTVHLRMATLTIVTIKTPQRRVNLSSHNP